MPDVTLAEFRARFPVFAAGTSNAAIETAIEEAHQLADTSHDASLFCVAHLITLLAEETADLDGGSGVVSKETIGPRIVEYVTQAMTDRQAFFAVSAYGRRMLAIEGRTPKAAMGVVIA